MPFVLHLLYNLVVSNQTPPRESDLTAAQVLGTHWKAILDAGDASRGRGAKQGECNKGNFEVKVVEGCGVLKSSNLN